MLLSSPSSLPPSPDEVGGVARGRTQNNRADEPRDGIVRAKNAGSEHEFFGTHQGRADPEGHHGAQRDAACEHGGDEGDDAAGAERDHRANCRRAGDGHALALFEHRFYLVSVSGDSDPRRDSHAQEEKGRDAPEAVQHEEEVSLDLGGDDLGRNLPLRSRPQDERQQHTQGNRAPQVRGSPPEFRRRLATGSVLGRGCGAAGRRGCFHFGDHEDNSLAARTSFSIARTISSCSSGGKASRSAPSSSAQSCEMVA